MPDEGLWDVKDVAKFLKRSERWVYTALALDESERGSIPHVRIGLASAPRFAPAAIRAWVDAGCPPFGEFRKAWEDER